jgi:hypothetical protein
MIAKSKLEEAIDYFIQHGDQSFENEVILYSQRYQKVSKEKRMNVIKKEDADIEINKICLSLLEAVDKIEVEASPANDYKLDSELQDILALAETQSRRDGKDVTSTKYFFAALVKLQPKSLQSMLMELANAGAMPTPISDQVATLPRVFSASRPLSACLTNTAVAMRAIVDEGTSVKTEDFFVDVAKYGKGNSVQKLRNHGVDGKAIDNMVKAHHVSVKSRETPNP